MSVPNGRDVLEEVRNCALEASSEERTALITLAEQAAANKISWSRAAVYVQGWSTLVG